MSLKSGRNGQLFLAEYDLSGSANKYEITFSRELIDGTTFTSSGRKYHPVLHRDSFSFDGFYDGAADIHTELEALRTATSTHLCSLVVGISQGDDAISGQVVWLEQYPLEVSVADLLRASCTFVFENVARAGYLLHPKTTRTSDGNGTGNDDGSSSSNGAEAYLHVFSCDVPDLVIKVQHDSDSEFATAADLITFTTVTGATSERKTASGTVNRYIRVTWSGTWTGDKSASFAVIFARL